VYWLVSELNNVAKETRDRKAVVKIAEIISSGTNLEDAITAARIKLVEWLY
jgi:hypothetical protein